MLLYEERIYKADVNIKYLLKESIKNKDKLVIIFSGFDNPPKYRYTLTLRGFDINQLFILDDYKTRGGYYIGASPEFLQEKAVASLIEKIMYDKKIKKENVICVGSSKGGWAAIYFAVKYNFKAAIVGAPQTKIMTYLQSIRANDVIDDMIQNNKDFAIIDNKLLELINEKKELPMISIQLGIGDDHCLFKHIIPLFDLLKSRKQLHKLNLKFEQYNEHNEVGLYFPSYLSEKIIETFPNLSNSLYFKFVDIKFENNKFIINAKANAADEYAWYVYCDGKEIYTQRYSKNNTFTFGCKGSGKYKFGVFAKNNNNHISTYTRVFEI